MKNLYVFAASFALILAFVHPAAAFSSDTNTHYQNTDGTAKFADPDEQMPGLVAGPATSQNGAMLPMQPFASPGVTPPAAAQNTDGARAFNQAFSHQQSGQ